MKFFEKFFGKRNSNLEEINVNKRMISAFKDIYTYPFEVVDKKDVKALSEKYLQAFKKGIQEGFTPVYIVLDDILLEKLEIEIEDSNEGTVNRLFDTIIEKSHEVDVDAFFQNKNDFKDGFEEDYKFDISSKHNFELMGTLDQDDVDLLLVQVPTDKPYEVLSYFPMGGFNDCPMPEEQTAISKKWYEKYGAVPALISHCEVEYYVQKPVNDLETVKDLACEHYVFCADIVDQGVDDIQALTDLIFDNVQWYFWWD